MKNLKIYIPTFFRAGAAGLMACAMMACNGVSQPVPANTDLILINQNAYQANASKIALIRVATSTGVALIDTTGKTVFTAEASDPKHWDLSGDAVAIADFSAFTQPGTYFLKVNDSIVSHPVVIADNAFEDVGKAAVRAFYYNRTAMPIDKEHGGVWARPAGHPDTVVYVHESAASAKRPAGTVLSLPLGWYDAGDYNKYVVNSGISTYTLLKALEDFPEYFATQNANIPESGNELPDLLDETLFNLRWVISMQDPNDGGVYHKLTEKNFEGFIMPHECKMERFVVAKATGATLNYAALLAKAIRVTEPWKQQLPGLADTCLTRALSAWDWAVKNPENYYQQPKDITTGGYGDNRVTDEFYWAACELYLTTGDKKFIPYIVKNYKNYGVPTWGNPGTLGTLSLMKSKSDFPAEIANLNIKADFIGMVDSLLMTEQTAPYKVSLSHFEWGSNSDVANQGMLKLIAGQVTGDRKYLQSAVNDADYILGRNATGYCFVTGFGSKKVMNIHHRPSAADGIVDPVPGFLSGGPNIIVLNDCDSAVVRDTLPAKSFADVTCSYSTNEIAINWNAPLAYLMNGLAASLK
jgi:endoglucanase